MDGILNQPAMESSGTAKFGNANGRQIYQTSVKGNMMGMPFEGIGISQDMIMLQNRFSAWFDNTNGNNYVYDWQWDSKVLLS